MLNHAQLSAREGRLTASKVACLMTADEPKILRLWQELTKDPHYIPDDLSDVWPVQLGEATEALNLRWFTREYGTVSRVGEVAIMPTPHRWAAATLDGWSDHRLCPVECKHCGGRENLATVIERYQPQMHWQMLVTGATQCALSVIMGANEPIVEFIPRDEEYAAELLQRAEAFMLCVKTKTPPVALPAVAAPVKAERVYDMNSSNSWAEAASIWLENRAAKQLATDAEKELKGLVPPDAKRAIGRGVEVRRDRSDRLMLRITQ